MKYILLGTAAALAISSASQAEVTFSKGVGSFSVGSSAFGTDIVVVSPEFDMAFNTGNFGFQVGSGMQYFTDFSNSLTVASFELHGYKNATNGNKFGAYMASGGGGFIPGSTTFGVEGMFDLGSLDVEASLGYHSFSGQNIYQGSIDLYYDLSANLEISAGYDILFSGSNNVSAASVGAAYAFGQSGYSVNAGYNFGFDGAQDTYEVGVSWAFGPNSDERLFGNRSLDIFLFGGP